MKKNFKDKKYLVGTWCEIPSPYVSNIISKVGIDIQIIDMEHSIFGYEQAQNSLFAIRSEGNMIFIRVPSINEADTLRALDLGADGIVFPHVETKEDINKILEISKFMPIGNRGFNPFITAGGYGELDGKGFNKVNQNVKIGVILESKKAIENIEEIIGSPWIDIIYIGQYDLSVSLGVAGDINNNKMKELISSITKRVNSAGKICGCMIHSSKEAKEMLDIGIKFLVYKADTTIIRECYQNFLYELEKENHKCYS